MIIFIIYYRHEGYEIYPRHWWGHIWYRQGGGGEQSWGSAQTLRSGGDHNQD